MSRLRHRKCGGKVVGEAPARNRGGATYFSAPLRGEGEAPKPRADRRARGGGQWIKGAIKHPGSLRKALHVKEGEKIPVSKLNKAAHSSNPKLRRKAALAKTLSGFHH